MSQSSGHADNHKTVGEFIPAGQWGEDVFVDSQLVKRNLLDIEKKNCTL